jgi:hypothetical protein
MPQLSLFEFAVLFRSVLLLEEDMYMPSQWFEFALLLVSVLLLEEVR